MRERLDAGAAPAATSCSPRSTPCTPTRGGPRHRLVAGRRPLRPAGAPRPLADRHPQPRHRGRRAPGSGCRVADHRPPRRRAGRYHAFHAARAELLRRLGRRAESRAAYDEAIALAGNTAETAYPSHPSRRARLTTATCAGVRTEDPPPPRCLLNESDRVLRDRPVVRPAARRARHPRTGPWRGSRAHRRLGREPDRLEGARRLARAGRRRSPRSCRTRTDRASSTPSARA